jgi:hypothetical protein
MNRDSEILDWLSSLTDEQFVQFNTFRAGTEFCGDVRLAALAAMPVEVAVPQAVGQ